ncbi:hypothetical protein LC087_11115 [Bacillus carboniphilus]|uniref:Uncharacterized protein n=1 Tax=Bacillus carboniphilus TaxID=86663 RepID=A0ABY9JT41_9BACI|nr:hypothetical protein [Bacillus carboniphilus]WLR41448.1 hypothetical protein LC087_11115 [Bacillus carboniphilus]
MDSILDLSYDQHNQPEFSDLQFILPGKNRVWQITRDHQLDLIIQEMNESALTKMIEGRISV